MFTLAGIKRRTARAMDSGPLEAEAAMTFLDGCLCIGILSALGVNIVFGWWWADAVAALGIGMFAAREDRESLEEAREPTEAPCLHPSTVDSSGRAAQPADAA